MAEYRGVSVPDDGRDYHDPENDPYVRGWKDGVDAHYLRTLEIQNAAMESMRLLLTNRVYRGVLVPEGQTAGFYSGWKSGVDEMLSRRRDKDSDEDIARQIVDAMPPEVAAFIGVTDDRPDTAREHVRRMSGRDRAVLSFYLRTLSDIVEDEEFIRKDAERLSRTVHGGQPLTDIPD